MKRCQRRIACFRPNRGREPAVRPLRSLPTCTSDPGLAARGVQRAQVMRLCKPTLAAESPLRFALDDLGNNLDRLSAEGTPGVPVEIGRGADPSISPTVLLCTLSSLVVDCSGIALPEPAHSLISGEKHARK